MRLPKGYYDKVLVMDCETTGLFFNQDDPSFDAKTKKTHQSLSWGLVVADFQTLKQIDELYVEIKWNGVSEWNSKAEQVHGLSKHHLEANGVAEEDAAIEIVEFVDRYWPRDAELSANRNVRCMGHNVASFDIWFMRRLLKQFGIMFPTGNRYIDVASVGSILLTSFTSDQIFEELGLPPRTLHNSLEDSKMTLESARRMRNVFNLALKG